MGLGPNVLALYAQLKQQGAFDNVQRVLELGAQGVWTPDPRLLRELYTAWGRDPPTLKALRPYIGTAGIGKASSRLLHEGLGLQYECIDISGEHGALQLDLNFDALPAEHYARYDLVTNHGTTEHIMNQYNCFKLIHNATRYGGLMLHGLPFTVHLDHGFFNYQPAFFAALAKQNRYETLGVWVGLDWTLSSFVPWEPGLIDHLRFRRDTTHLILVLQRKLSDRTFRMPIKGSTETLGLGVVSPFQLAVNGERYAMAGEPPAIDSYPTGMVLAEFMRRVARRLLGVKPR